MALTSRHLRRFQPVREIEPRLAPRAFSKALNLRINFNVTTSMAFNIRIASKAAPRAALTIGIIATKYPATSALVRLRDVILPREHFWKEEAIFVSLLGSL